MSSSNINFRGIPGAKVAGKAVVSTVTPNGYGNNWEKQAIAESFTSATFVWNLFQKKKRVPFIVSKIYVEPAFGFLKANLGSLDFLYEENQG
ncbi:hypothetical protein ABD91_27105 [Lysinibacillus sphaericus]|nr:hypothetical protein [Lysinibacillus sphaericus]MBG9756805.1 hypothetical protein [Lysinibacillus sphaericus]